jgi:hypothetical protein
VNTEAVDGWKEAEGERGWGCVAVVDDAAGVVGSGARRDREVVSWREEARRGVNRKVRER